MANKTNTTAKITKRAAAWLTEEGLARIAGWARRGLTDDQIAANMGIRRSTLAVWRGNWPELESVLQQNKDVADVEVENALYKRAVGYSYNEETYYRDKSTGELILTKRITKQVAPDVTAQMYWLRNRKPDEWREKPAPMTEAESTLGSYFDALTDAFKQHAEIASGGDNNVD